MRRTSILISIVIALTLAAFVVADDIFKLVEQGQITAVKKLLEKSPELARATDERGNTPLHIAASIGFSEIAELLLANDADVKARNDSEITPLHTAVYGGKIECVKLLIKHGADAVNNVWKHNYTLLHMSAMRNDSPIMKVLIKAGADINAVKENGTAVIHDAARWMSYEALELLIKEGADVNVRNDEAETPLMILCEHASYNKIRNGVKYRRPEEIAKLLIDAGADLDLKSDNEEWTALHSAVWFGHESLVKLLLDSGAKIDAEHSLGETPLDFARKQGRKNIIRLLEGYKKK